MGFRSSIPSLVAVFVLMPLWAIQGAVTLAPPFTDNMVMQRNQPIPLYGRATAGSSLHIKLGDQTADATANDQGDWKTMLPAMPAGGPFNLTIDGDGGLTLQDVLVGDVWFVSGQSNMEMPLCSKWGNSPGILNGAAEVSAADQPNIHFLHQKRANSTTPLTTVTGAWQVCTPATVGQCSAVAYFFAQDLEAREHIPIGLICSYAGGTPIESWTPADALAKAGGYATFGPRWQHALEMYPGWKAEYDKNVAAQKAAIEEAKKNGAPPPPSHYISPPSGSPERAPGALYNAMIAPFTTVPITGIIWYQGEDNVVHADEYRSFFPAMITSWRSAWNKADLPFLFVQLSNFRPTVPAPGPSNWAELREAQAGALQLPNTGMAVSLDLGEAANIHYANKKPAGLRLAQAARALVYGEKIEVTSPLYDSMSKEGTDTIRITFSNAPQGLKTSDGGAVQGFAVAGDDHVFHPADATIDGSSVLVKSSQVPQPSAVRYAWADNPVANLAGGDGLPVGSFRTDTLPH